MVEINNQTLEVRDGTATKRLPFGTYNYRVQAPQYYPEVGNIIVSDPDNKHVVKVQLKPAFSSFTFKSSDQHAEIWINGEKRGIGEWKGEMGYESVLLECKRENYRSTSKEITLDATMSSTPILLDAPTPIYGSLDVNSSPAGATLFIDEEKVGETPIFINKQIIGHHQIRLNRSGYGDYTTTVNVLEGQTTSVEGWLTDAIDVKFISNVPKANLLIDGKNVGSSSGTYSVTYGTHTISLKAEGYKQYSATINVTQETTSFDISLESVFGKKAYTVNGVSFTMVDIEGGTFIMGATNEMQEPWDDEKPTHQVTLSNYSIGESEVTQALWNAVMPNNPSNFIGDNKPVEQVSWDDCQEFIVKLNFLTGEHFRLPTEAEWEYAARGGKKNSKKQYSGSNFLSNVAWYNGYTSHDVKTSHANELGLYDMSGNVWEWCSDYYGEYSRIAQTNPQGPQRGSYRIYRGGGWGNIARQCRVSCRGYGKPSTGTISLGFRLAK